MALNRPINCRGYFGAAALAAGTPGFTTDTTAYTTNDVLGGLIIFPISTANGIAIIDSIKVMDNDTKGVVGDLYLFNALPTTIADNDAFAGTLVLADWLARASKTSFASYDTDSAFKTCQVALANKVHLLDKGFLYGYYQITGTAPTFANGKLFDVALEGFTQ